MAPPKFWHHWPHWPYQGRHWPYQGRRKLLRYLVGAIAPLILLATGHFLPSPPAQAANSTVLVSAAASLKEVLEEIKPLYQRANPTITLRYNFGASGALLRQVQQGAPVDIFIAAAAQPMDTLAQTGALVSETRANLANNRLVLIVPKQARGIESFRDLSKPEVKRIAMGEPRSVPAGQYGEQVLRKLQIYEALKSKLVLGNTVRQVLAAVESGNAEAGLVYLTDAKLSDKVKVVVIADDTYHSRIVYPMAVLRRSRVATEARAFVQYLTGNEAKGVLRKYGFIV